MERTIDLTPSTTAMMVIARTKEAVYLRLPRELQRDIEGACECPHCKVNPALAKWDTLVIATKAPKRANDFSHIVHMPDLSVQAFLDYCENKGLLSTEAR